MSAESPSGPDQLLMQLFANAFIILGAILFGMPFAPSYYYVLSRLDLSVDYPIITSRGYAIVILLFGYFLAKPLPVFSL